MSDFLKGNFETVRKVTESSLESKGNDLESRFRKNALGCIGGSMVYVERTALEWDGENE